jgi:hypothetical protein
MNRAPHDRSFSSMYIKQQGFSQDKCVCELKKFRFKLLYDSRAFRISESAIIVLGFR